MEITIKQTQNTWIVKVGEEEVAECNCLGFAQLVMSGLLWMESECGELTEKELENYKNRINKCAQ